MNYDANNSGPEVPSVFLSARRPSLLSWPTVLGAVSILLAAAYLAVPAVYLAHSRDRLNEQQLHQALGALAVVAALEAILAGGGIGLLLRKPVARRLHLIYAWIVVAMLVVNIALDPLTAGTPEGSQLIHALGWILVAIYPAFLLIWFRRPTIRRQMRTW